MIVLKISPVILWLFFLEKVLCDDLSDIRVPSSFGFRTSRRQRQGLNHPTSVENQEKISIAVNEGKLKDEKTLEIKAYQFNHPPSTDNEEIISVTIRNQSNDDKSVIVNANEQRNVTEQSQIHPSEVILESNDKRQIIKNYISENKTLDDSRKRNSRTRGNRQRSRLIEKETVQKIDESINIQGSEKVIESGKKFRQNEKKIPVAIVYEDDNTKKENFLEVKSYKFNHPPFAEKDEIIPVAMSNDKDNIKYEKSVEIKTKPNPDIYKENIQRKVIEQSKTNPTKENLETKKSEEFISEIKQTIDNKNQLTATYKSEDKSLEQFKTRNSRTRGNRQRNQIIENNAAVKNYESKSKNSEDKENSIKTDKETQESVKSLSEMIIPVKVVYEEQTAQISRNQNRRIYSDRPRGFQLLKIDEKPIDASKKPQSISNDEKSTITTYHPPASITTTPNGPSAITRTNLVTPSVNINELEIKALPYLKPENKNISKNNKNSDMTSNVETNSFVKLSTETKLSSVQSITNINQSEIQHTQTVKDKLNLEVTISAVTNSPIKHTTENKLTLVNSEKIINELESKEARDSKTKLNSGLPQETDNVNISKISTGKRRRERDPIVPIIESTNNVYSHSGSFKYSYESGDGTKAFSQGELKTFDEDKAGEAVVGGFSYKDKDGKDFSLTYTADENGYRPVGDHLPTPPPIPVAIARALRYLATKTTPEPVTEAVKSESSTFKIDTQSSLLITNTQVFNTTFANLESTTRSVKPINSEPELKQKANI